MPRRQLQPPSSSGEEFDAPSSGSSSSDESDPENDLLSRGGTAHLLTISSNPTREEYDEALKKAQLLCGKRDKEVRQLREELATIKVNQPKRSRRSQGNSGYPQVIAKHEEEIASIGRMFSLTCELFLPDNYNTVITNSSRPQQSLVNSPQRYVTKAAEEAGVLSEIYETVPERFHGLMREHSQFGVLFCNKHRKVRSTFLKELRDKIIPKIFGAELRDVANQIGASHAAKRASNNDFQELLRWDMARNKYPKFAPVLYAARESDGRRIDDRTKVFMNPQLVLALKGLLTGAASITKVGKYAKPKTRATLWGLLGVTPGSIAGIAILVCFIFSPDPELSAGKGAVTGIDYGKDFTLYKMFIIQKLNTPYGKVLFDLYNQIIFGSATVNTIANDPGDGDESSGIEDATNQFHTLSLAPAELATHGNIEQVALDTLPTSSNAEQRIISAGPSQEHSPSNPVSVAQEQPLSTTRHAAPSTLVTPEARVVEKSKKGKAREKGTVQDTAAEVVEAVPGTRKPRKPRARKT
ncbi:uncharacterized protein LACBIDRAFT_313198 [Laccaria bicolor S238N-H82]|uniref:Predicted protein n=1 Tax=Laccaria bicolor (strain S238N-H82 / ATCC MYA-4686) TaxID=486041 RepID=B0DXS3_LACBS|nr:uncharacterized protein LACBIDRAFT_313198 [Laccaria bicolor S238N-H82]EDR00664.1 predicted protein [Laccaria bicolor S238N-H82]|eukprot:XP_001888673.1 predicted protein [Laccaria bicolor S238N-H82]